MTEALFDRIKRYSKDEILEVTKHEDITREDLTYLCALTTHGMVFDNSLVAMKTISIPVVETYSYPTGYFFRVGFEPMIVINELDSILDYDLISELHPTHDSEVYLWLMFPWHVIESPMAIHGEWYRSDTYKDGIKPFDGKTLGWEDLAPVIFGEDDNDNSER